MKERGGRERQREKGSEEEREGERQRKRNRAIDGERDKGERENIPKNIQYLDRFNVKLVTSALAI